MTGFRVERSTQASRGFAAFLIILLVRPSGFFPRTRD